MANDKWLHLIITCILTVAAYLVVKDPVFAGILGLIPGSCRETWQIMKEQNSTKEACLDMAANIAGALIGAVACAVALG